MLSYLLVLLERNRASGVMLPVAQLPVFHTVPAHGPHSTTICL